MIARVALILAVLLLAGAGAPPAHAARTTPSKPSRGECPVLDTRALRDSPELRDKVDKLCHEIAAADANAKPEEPFPWFALVRLIIVIAVALAICAYFIQRDNPSSRI